MTVDDRRTSALRWALFVASKRWWYASVLANFVAILIVPVTVLWVPSLRMLSPLISVGLSITGVVLLGRVDAIRGDAEQLLKQQDLREGMGRSRNPRLVAGIQAEHSHRFRSRGGRQRPPEPYYSSEGEPSARLLVMHMRESAWYTERLARAAVTKLCWVGVPLGVLTVVGLAFAEPLLTRIYGIAVCGGAGTHAFHILWRYHRMATDCGSAFRDLDELSRMGELTDADALVATGVYQHVRSAGPPIPEWLWRRKRANLESAWAGLVEDGMGASQSDGHGR